MKRRFMRKSEASSAVWRNNIGVRPLIVRSTARPDAWMLIELSFSSVFDHVVRFISPGAV
jgi:hypothetical protein